MILPQIVILIILMEKSAMQKLAQSTFTSQFFASSGKAETQKRLTAIKNNRVTHLHSLTPQEALTSTDSSQKPLLLYAAFYNSPPSALYLLHRGAKIEQEDNQGKSVFHICAYTGHVQVLRAVQNQLKINRLRILNQKYIDLLLQNNYKRTDFKEGELKFAVSEIRKKAFQKIQLAITKLYRDYANQTVDQTFKRFMMVVKATNRNCFHLACLNRYQRCLNVLQYMLTELGDIQVHINHEVIQLYGEVSNCFDEIYRVDPRIYEDTLNLIRQVINPQTLAQINREIEMKVEEFIEQAMQSKDLEGHTPLHTASKNGYTAIINLLRKWETKKTRKGQNTEDLIKVANHNLARSHIMDLCEAAKVADPKKMDFLLSCGEEINRKKTVFGTFALLEAVKSFQKQRNLEPIRLLILSGADVNVQDTNGWTIMHHACERGLKEVMSELFRIWEEGKCKKIALNKLTNKNYHILHLAAMNNHADVIEFLITSPSAKKLQLNTGSVDGDECTMLHHASKRGALQALRKILQLVPGILYAGDVRSNSALHYAAMGDHNECIKYLLYFDADYDKLQEIRNSRGKLAKDLTVNKKPFQNIFTAAKNGDVNLVRKMVEENKELKKAVTLEKGRNLLILGVLHGHLLVAKYLIAAGIDQSHRDKFNKSAKDYAQQGEQNCKGKQELVAMRNILALFD